MRDIKVVFQQLFYRASKKEGSLCPRIRFFTSTSKRLSFRQIQKQTIPDEAKVLRHFFLLKISNGRNNTKSKICYEKMQNWNSLQTTINCNFKKTTEQKKNF